MLTSWVELGTMGEKSPVQRITFSMAFWLITMNTYIAGLLERVYLILDRHQIRLYRGEDPMRCRFIKELVDPSC